MRALLCVAAVAIALVACGGGADTSRLGPAAAPTATHVASPIASPFNLDDMMGLYATQTVFVADVEKISAITLLNHFTRYTIPTNGKAQVAADASSPFGSPTSSNASLWSLTNLAHCRAASWLNSSPSPARHRSTSKAKTRKH